MKNLAEVKGIVIAYGMGQIRNGKDVRSFDEPYGLGDPFPGDVFCYGYIQFLAENLTQIIGGHGNFPGDFARGKSRVIIMCVSVFDDFPNQRIHPRFFYVLQDKRGTGIRKLTFKKEAQDEPAVIFGKNYAYVSLPLFTDYINNGYRVHREIIRSCIDRLLPDRLILTDLPTVTEMTVRENEEAYMIHLLNYVMQKKSKRLELIEETYAVSDRHLFIKLQQQPKMVLLQPEGTELPAIYQDGYVRVDLPAISGHTMIEVLKDVEVKNPQL